ncbi:MAG TPA: serine/threonine-protein kinase [Planctomycetota bacterium]|nr:serine/threonine-protein kinase [Planctomycetota bacterium]
MSASSGDDLNKTLTGPLKSAASANTISVDLGATQVPGAAPLGQSSLGGSGGAGGHVMKGDDAALAKALATLPNYQIEKKLGEGGMGAVYKATQKNLQRTVAVKVLPQRLANNALYVARLNREAIVLAKISHPNVTGCYDLGEHQGMRYVVMEFVEGETLGELIEKRKIIHEREALHYLKQAVSGLDYANSLGIIHRDIKPDNMLLYKPRTTQTTVRMAAGYQLKIADLGLATFTTEEAENTRLTTEGSALGSPHYMSPEQTVGESDLDFRTDVYALGITMYHMVTGKTPFTAATVGAVLAKKLSETIPDPRTEHPELSPGVSLLIQKMTARKREDRYANYGDLLIDIENVENGRAMNAVPLPQEKAGLALLPDTVSKLKKLTAGSGKPGEQPAQSGAKNNSALVLGAGIAVLIVGGLALAAFVGKKPGQNSQIVVVSTQTSPKPPAQTQNPVPVENPESKKAPPASSSETFTTQLLIDKEKRSTAGWTYSGDPKDFIFQEGSLFLQSLKGWNFAERQLPGSEYVLSLAVQTPMGGDNCELHLGISPAYYVACGIRLPADAKRVTAYVEKRDAKTHAVIEAFAKVDELSVDDPQSLRIQVWDGQATCFLNGKFMVSAEVEPEGAKSKLLRLAVKNGIAQYTMVEVSPRPASK